MSNSIFIKNGTIVSPSGQLKSNILIQNGKIAAIDENIPRAPQTKEIDATDQLILPGGIDPHVHLALKTTNCTSSDNFISGSIAALAGGTTCIIDFVHPEKNQSFKEALELRKTEAKGSLIDYAFHMGITYYNDNTLSEIKNCIYHEGIPSFKIYMAYQDTVGLPKSEIIKVIKDIKTHNALLLAHAEDEQTIKELQKGYIEKENTSPQYHALSRPAASEEKAVSTIINLAAMHKIPLYLVHISTAESLKHIKKVRAQNLPILAETCPQYLLLNDSVYALPEFKGAAYVMSPPIRSEEHNIALWESLINDGIQVIATDHCSFHLHEQKKLGKNDFRLIPGGAAGIQHRLSLIYTYGVLQNKLSLSNMVNLCSTAPAKIFGLYPQKGTISVGSDADLVIWNTNIEETISASNHLHNCDTSIFENIKIKGKPDYVIVNGNIVYDKGLINIITPGRFIKRTNDNLMRFDLFMDRS